ncbi:MAG: hypothetical protein JOY93_11215 [Acidobacteriales bacterium]|nr:hypothetical protein [Terriglobales bacterium]
MSSVLATRRSTVVAADTGEKLPMTAPDQVLVSGTLAGGAPVSIHYRGGLPRDGLGFIWEINGTYGDIRVTGPFGHPQAVQLSLQGAHGNEKEYQLLEVPDCYRGQFPENPIAGNVARVYAKMARDLREGTHTAPSFDDGVKIHRVIAAIEKGAHEGQVVDEHSSR